MQRVPLNEHTCPFGYCTAFEQDLDCLAVGMGDPGEQIEL